MRTDLCVSTIGLLALTGCADRGECLEIFVGGVQVPMSFEVHVREEA